MKHHDPWSKGSQAGSNVPETTQSKLLAHLRKTNDARGLPKMGTFGQPAALDKDRNKERLKGSGSARRTKRGDQCEESQALHCFSRALNFDGQNGNQNSRARIVKSTGEAPEGSTKCAQQLCACFSARPNLLHGVARLRRIISAARHHSRGRGQAQRAAAARTCDQRQPSCAVEPEIDKKDK